LLLVACLACCRTALPPSSRTSVEDAADRIVLPPPVPMTPESNDWLRRNSNVILFTWDGVRPEEVFDDADQTLLARDDRPLTPRLRGELSRRGILVGRLGAPPRVRLANGSRMSLPGYQSIMAGSRLDCEANTCGRIPVETVLERARRELGWPVEAAACIASWKPVRLAAEHVEGSVTVNAGLVSTPDPPWSPGTTIAIEPAPGQIFNSAPRTEPPVFSEKIAVKYHQDRPDAVTMDYGLQYLRAHRPRLLFLSLGDSDNFAHDGDSVGYLSAIRRYDAYLKVLLATLADLGEYGRHTTVLVTTDHGRGRRGCLFYRPWREHGEHEASENVWLYATGPFLRPDAAPPAEPEITHRDLRPTIERLLGLCPQSCATCGRPVASLLGAVADLPDPCGEPAGPAEAGAR